MVLIYYSIDYIDKFGNRGHTPDYSIYFDKTNPLSNSDSVLEMMGKVSFESKNPGYRAISVSVVSKQDNVYR